MQKHFSSLPYSLLLAIGAMENIFIPTLLSIS